MPGAEERGINALRSEHKQCIFFRFLSKKPNPASLHRLLKIMKRVG